MQEYGVMRLKMADEELIKAIRDLIFILTPKKPIDEGTEKVTVTHDCVEVTFNEISKKYDTITNND